MAFGAEVANLIVALKLDDSGFTGKLNNAARTLGRMDQGLSRMGRGAGQVGSGLARLGTVAATAAAGGLAAVVTTAISFEDAFAGVEKTVDATEEQLEALNEGFRAMAREIPLSFEELAGIGETAGALGIAREDILEFTRVVALIGTTTDVTSQDAATALGQLQNVLGLTADEFDNFGAALVDLGNKGASTESQILAIASRAGAGAKLLGLSASQTLGFASAVANLGIEAEAGGSSLQNFFLKLIKVTATTNDVTDALDQVADLGVGGFKKALEEDAEGAIISLLEGMKKLDRGAQLLFLKQLDLNDIRITRTILGLLGNTENLTKSLDDSAAAWEKNTALTIEAEKRFETTKSQLLLLKNNLRDVGATIGVELLPMINELTKEFVEFINTPEAQAGIKDFAEGLASGIRSLADELKGTDFSGLVGGLQLAATVAKGAFDAFRALPAPVQQLAIAALIANKVSGGAVGQIAKGLTNIAFGGLQAGIGGIFGGRGTTPANPLFVSAVGGLGGAGGATGRGGGLGNAAAGLIGTAGLIATIQGGMISLEDIQSGTREGVIDGMLSQGVAGLITNAVEGPVKELLGVEEGNTAEIIGELKNSTTTQKISDNLLLDEARHNRADLAAGTQAIADRVIGLRAGVEGKLTDLETGLGGKTQIVADRITGLHSGMAAKLERANVLQGNVVDRVAAMRAGMEGKLERSNVLLGNINAKDFSPNVNLQQTISVSATLSASEAAAAIKINNIIRSGKGDALLNLIS